MPVLRPFEVSVIFAMETDALLGSHAMTEQLLVTAPLFRAKSCIQSLTSSIKIMQFGFNGSRPLSGHGQTFVSLFQVQKTLNIASDIVFC